MKPIAAPVPVVAASPPELQLDPWGIAADPKPVAAGFEVGQKLYCTSEKQPDRDRWTAEMLWDLSDRLSDSDDPDMLIAAAVMSEPGPVRTQRIEAAVAAHPNDPLLRWLVVADCARDASACKRPDAVDALVAVDPNNSEAWAAKAVAAYNAGDDEAALAALRRASAATESNWYYLETIVATDRSLIATGLPFSDRSAIAFGIGGAQPLPSASDLAEMCRHELAAAVAWRDACVRYARTMAQQSQTVLSVMLGLSLEAEWSRLAGDADGAASASQKLEALRARRGATGAIVDYGRAVEAVLTARPDVYYRYLDTFAAKGEFDAQAEVRLTLDALLASGEMPDC